MFTYKLIDYSDKRKVYKTFQAENDFIAAEIAKIQYQVYWLGLYRFDGRKRLYEIDFRSIFRDEYINSFKKE